MNRQIAMEFGDGVRATNAYVELLRIFDEELIEGMRLKEAAGRLGLESGTLSNKIRGEQRSVLHAREFFLLLFTATDAQRRGVIERIARECGYALEEIVTRSPEEELADLKERVAKEFGRAGEKVVAQVEGRK